MDLVPKPDQLVSAAGNVAHRLLRGQIGDLRTVPRTLVDDGDMREVYHYLPSSVRTEGDPVLLVSSLAAPSLAFDLRRGCSLVEHLVGRGRATYVLEYGEISFRDRSLSLERWVDDVVPTAVREVSRHAGDKPVHLVGWSLGGLLALLAAADDASLPVASVTVVSTPGDVSQVPLVAPRAPLIPPPEARGLYGRTFHVLGSVPAPLLHWAIGLPAFQSLVSRPLALAVRLDDAEFLAQVEAVDRFTRRMQAYPGRTYGQLFHRFVRPRSLVDGEITLGARTIRLAEVSVPVLVVAGATDQIAPVASVSAVVGMLTGSEQVDLEIVPGGHLGALTGREARETTWPAIEGFLDRWSAPADVAAPAPEPRSRATIGTSAQRRYGSGGSRALAP